MFQRQEELVAFVRALLEGEAPGLVEKSRDMGATWTCIAFSVWMWLFWPGAAVGWGSRKQEQVDRIGDPSSIFEKIRRLISWLPKHFTPPPELRSLKQYACINGVNDASIIGEIGDDIGRGGRTRVYFVDEAGHLERPELVEAALSENTRVRIDVSSVSGLGTVFHRTREAGVDWVPGASVVKDATNVFVMDWSDHPEKTPEWHAGRKKYFEGKGLPHVFAREIERDYAAAVEGVIIPQEWVVAAIDAHIKLDWQEDGWVDAAGLDVADTGQDTNAFTRRKGPILRQADEWAERDVGATTRRAIGHIKDYSATTPVTEMELQYDCIGIGASVKSEANRLIDDNLMPEFLTLVPWNAAATVLNPHKRLIQFPNGEDDPESPKNKDVYANLKVQGWWELRMRFYRTFQAVTTGMIFDPVTLISLPSDLPLIRKIQKELSQAVAVKDTKLRLKIDKAPEGAKSPNLADSIVMNYWPWHGPEPATVSMFGPIIVTG